MTTCKDVSELISLHLQAGNNEGYETRAQSSGIFS